MRCLDPDFTMTPVPHPGGHEIGAKLGQTWATEPVPTR